LQEGKETEECGQGSENSQDGVDEARLLQRVGETAQLAEDQLPGNINA
jgi:hypothetical protein